MTKRSGGHQFFPKGLQIVTPKNFNFRFLGIFEGMSETASKERIFTLKGVKVSLLSDEVFANRVSIRNYKC